jgi:hypothetical protein
VLAVARHFADHRAFHRAVLTGSCAFALNQALIRMMIPLNRQFVRQIHGEQLIPDLVEDLALFSTGGAAALFNAWVVEGDDPLDPEAFTDRLMRTMPPITVSMRQGTAATPHKEHDHP